MASKDEGDREAFRARAWNLGSWLAVAESLGNSLTVLRFGDGWKALFGVYREDEHYAYLLACRPAATPELACKELLLREHFLPNYYSDVLSVENHWAAQRADTFLNAARQRVRGLQQKRQQPVPDETQKFVDELLYDIRFDIEYGKVST